MPVSAHAANLPLEVPYKTKSHAHAWLFLFLVGIYYTLRRFAANPFAQVQVLFNFPALITMFERFFGLVIHLSEWMFGVADRLTDHFQRFGHSVIFLFLV
jgi:hypothetical protein